MLGCHESLNDNYKTLAVIFDGPYLWIDRHENGQIAAKGMRQHDKPHGHWTFWCPDGQKEGEGEYRQGREHGEWIYWYKDGTYSVVVYENGARVE